MSEEISPSRQLIEEPDYVHLDNRNREEFLSQMGNFSPRERELFHLICKRWQPEIPYEQFVRHVEHASTDLTGLLEKLKKQRIGMLTQSYSAGSYKPETIIISSRDSIHFYSKIIESYYIGLQETLAAPLPFAKEVFEQYPHMPKDETIPLNYLQLLQALADKPSEMPIMYSLPVHGEDSLLATPKSLQWIIHAAMGKMRAFFSNPDNLELAAKILNTSMLDIKQKLDTRLPDFWQTLTENLIAKESEIHASRSLRLSSRFFQICSIINQYIKAQIELAEQNKKDREDRELDMKSIVQTVKDYPNRLISEEEIQDLIDGFSEKYGKSFAAFKAEFRSTYMLSKKSIAKLNQIQEHWVHIDNLFPEFAARMDAVQGQLMRHYVKQMEKQLRSNNRSNSEVFYSKENFELDILNTIEGIDEFLAHSLQRPGLISEALVHHLKRKGKIKGPDDLRAHLMVFFHARTLLFLPLAEIFNLNLGEIFERGFTKLPLWRQIMIRLFGRYNSLQDKFIGRSFNSYKQLMKNEQKDRNAILPPGGNSSQGDRAERNSSRRRGSSSASGYPMKRTSSSQGGSQSSSQGSPTIKKSKVYKKSEQEEAWRKFGESLNN